ncbi:MAG: acyl-CoA dehydrogenase [Planctomycetes bacterium]|nr:acyl-CoA dehydrogenase [Planctomycetota bacterium]
MCSLIGLGILVLFLAIGFLGAPLIVWTLAILAVMWFLGAPIWALIVVALLFAPFNVRPLRRLLFSRQIAGFLRKTKLLPVISETERIALEAGTVWMDGELFSGKPHARKLLDVDEKPMSDKLAAFLAGPVERLCELVDDWDYWREKDLRPEAWAYMKEAGFFGLIVPEEYGGHGFGASELSAIVHKLASRSFALSVTVMIPNSLGPAELLHHYGTPEQKARYLPALAKGEEVPCFALTEPGAGSDAGGIRARGKVFKDGDGKVRIRVDFEKRYTSLATFATVIGLAFKLEDPEELLGQGKAPGITCALVPAELPGIDRLWRHDPLGVPFHNCAVFGRGVVIEPDAIIGGPAFAGQGWRMLMECLAAGRGIALPAAMVANAKLSARVAGAYAMLRYQFGLPVAAFEAIEEPLGRIGARAYLMEAARRYTNAAIDQGAKPSVLSAIVKYHFTELSRLVVADGMDVLAGAGISRGPRNLLAAAHVASPIPVTVEGANILTRGMIIFGQGAMRCHPFARDQVMALERDDMKAFDRAFWGHMGHFLRNGLRSCLLSMSRGWLGFSPVTGPTARYWRRLKWASASFAFLADLAMISLGGDLKRRELLSARLGDILSWMYLATAVLHRHEKDGRIEADRPLVLAALDHCFQKMQQAFEEVQGNMPVPVAGALLRGPISLWSRLNAIGGPIADARLLAVAETLKKPGAQRERLLDLMYLPQDEQSAMGRFERAFAVSSRADAVAAKIRAAQKEGKLGRGRPEKLLEVAAEAGIVDAEEVALYRQALDLRWDAIQVDAFPAAEFAARTPTPGPGQAEV